MKKIPTVFVRNPHDRAHVLDAVTPGCEWVLAGEGVATRKYDGTCVMLDGQGRWWARREVKPGKTPPAGWVQVDHDQVTGKSVGWEPIEQSPFARFHAEAVGDADQFGALLRLRLPTGTYELLGPKINGNPEKSRWHRLRSHANAEQIGIAPPLTFAVLRDLVLQLGREGYEGLVWHHPDGRMAKLKARDFR